MPLCIKTSGAWTVPLCSVWGLEEDTASMFEMVAMLRSHCEAHGVSAVAFSLRVVQQVNAPYACLCTLTIDEHATHSMHVCVHSSTFVEQAAHETDPSAKSSFRTFIYPPVWERFLMCAMDASKNDAEINMWLPCVIANSVLHCDSGTALAALHRQLMWDRTACAKHLEPNIASLNGNLKPLAMALLYGREISTHMACEIRDDLIAKTATTATCHSDTKAWMVTTFGTDAAMKVCVHNLTHNMMHD